ncbi:Calx-beta domain-containing protein [Sphingomonas sp.]|uniref:Calx-beta domain-containing protein n=1 Tax=Sphingomonas sp. TaxID=28214 RepID=UPI003D6CFD74
MALFASCATMSFAGVAVADERVVYTYDELGRLKTSSTTGTVNDGLQMSTTFDPAGNRTNYTVSGAVLPAISIADAPTVTEGSDLVFTVTRSGPITAAVSASWTTVAGTAAAGSDFTAVSGTVSFAIGEVSKTIRVTTINDTMVESAEAMTVTLSAPTGGATLGTATATGTINDNDVAGPPPSFAVSNAAGVAEGNPMIFTVTKTGTTTSSYSVNYRTSNGTATTGIDFTDTSGTLTFAPNETSRTVSVPTIDDTAVESPESIWLTLLSPSGGATITTANGTGNILDNDTPAPPSFTVGNAMAVTEGGTLAFTVTKTGPATASYSVNYATASGTATSGTDFTGVSGTLTFLSGEVSKPIQIVTIDDATVESAETVLVNLSAPTGGATLGTATATGTINDNDVAGPPPSFAVRNAAGVAEGNPMIFTVTKTGTTTSSYSVNYRTANGTATTGIDFTDTSGTLTFAPNETSRTVSVSTIDDTAVESPESIWLTLLSPSGGATITTANGTGNILNND